MTFPVLTIEVQSTDGLWRKVGDGVQCQRCKLFTFDEVAPDPRTKQRLWRCQCGRKVTVGGKVKGLVR